MNNAKASSAAARAFQLFLAGIARSNANDMVQRLAPDARLRLNGYEVAPEDLLRFMTIWSTAAPGGKRRLGFLDWVEIDVDVVDNTDERTSRIQGRVEFDHDGPVDLPGYGRVEPTMLAVEVPLLAVVTVDNQAQITSLEIDLDPEVFMTALLAS